jgi:hypothetical protein
LTGTITLKTGWVKRTDGKVLVGNGYSSPYVQQLMVSFEKYNQHSTGENVSTTEVEYVICNLTPGKLDTVAFPVKIPHTDGQAGMAVIADASNILNVDDLGEKMKKALPPYAIPLFLRIAREIEMTGMLKDWTYYGNLHFSLVELFATLDVLAYFLNRNLI